MAKISYYFELKMFRNTFHYGTNLIFKRQQKRIFINKNDDRKRLTWDMPIIVSIITFIRVCKYNFCNENILLSFFLQGQIDNNNFSIAYKHLALNLITNKHALLSVRQQTDNAEFIMRLVLVHIIAVHASLSAESSPLTLYLQKLQVVRNHFILTCPSDEETMIINALNEAHPGNGITRYAFFLPLISSFFTVLILTGINYADINVIVATNILSQIVETS